MKIYRNLLIVVALMMVLVVSGCNSEGMGKNQNVEKTVSSNTNVQKIEIYHFHGTNQCYSCKTVGAYAEETVNTYFAEEVKNGKVTFAHINGELAENRELVTKYGVTGSSLWIGVYDNEGFHKEENVNVWYKIDDKEAYMTYLKGIIEQKLGGN